MDELRDAIAKLLAADEIGGGPCSICAARADAILALPELVTLRRDAALVEELQAENVELIAENVRLRRDAPRAQGGVVEANSLVLSGEYGPDHVIPKRAEADLAVLRSAGMTCVTMAAAVVARWDADEVGDGQMDNDIAALSTATLNLAAATGFTATAPVRPQSDWHPEVRTFYVLRCRVCDEESGIMLPMPFESPEARGRWAAEHRAGTGHDRWDVTDEATPA